MYLLKKTLFQITFSILFVSISNAQNATQTLRGNLVDQISQAPIPGAVVLILNTNPQMAEITDPDGNFTFTNVKTGKHTLKITLLGYKDLIVPNLTVNAGKELVLNLMMEEDLKSIKEVVVKAGFDKNKPLNEMSTVSTRTFSVEETQKFAAAVNDPGRMASSFAGVVSAGDGSNQISIRGNSPNGLLWRMEGVDIPNPNHFASVGTSGGGISILSAQLLTNSDFSTGAFAAEYGNALSGVFDLKLRKGNNEKREYTAQIGLLGVDLAAEGPFKKGYKGSYLINYRYSTLSVLGKIGVPLGDAITNFQDLSYNIHLPAGRFGNFGLFGFGGLSDQTTKASKDSSKWQEDSYYRYSGKFISNTGVMGFTHLKLLKNQDYIKTSLVFSGVHNGDLTDKIQDDLSYKKLYTEKYLQKKTTLNSNYTRKINAKNSIKTGLTLNQLNYRLTEKNSFDTTQLITHIDESGSTQTAQAFVQWNHKFNSAFTGNVGLHYLHLFLNNTSSVEPRAAIKYHAGPKYTFSLGYGLHSQLQPIGIYFAKDYTSEDKVTKPNQDLKFTKAHHIVLGNDWSINTYSRLKTEIYYQHLFNVPVSTDPASTYSVLNSVEGFYTKPLSNNGLGKNYGLELTYERFTYKNLYYLVSASLYESKYKASNGNWYNTQFNTNYALTVTLGKEWQLRSEKKDRVLGFNFKSVYVGGYRNTPINLAASKEKGETVEFQERAFENKNPDYYRLDIRLSLKRNYEKVTGTVSLDIQNTTNRNNIAGQYFDPNTGSIKYWYWAPLIPILSYRLQF